MFTESEIQHLKVRINHMQGFVERGTSGERREVQAVLAAYWDYREAQGASLRGVAKELGMSSHTQLSRWLQTHKNRMEREAKKKMGAMSPAKVMPSPFNTEDLRAGEIRVSFPGGRSFRVTDPVKVKKVLAAAGRDLLQALAAPGLNSTGR